MSPVKAGKVRLGEVCLGESRQAGPGSGWFGGAWCECHGRQGSATAASLGPVWFGRLGAQRTGSLRRVSTWLAGHCWGKARLVTLRRGWQGESLLGLVRLGLVRQARHAWERCVLVSPGWRGLACPGGE